MEVTLPHRFTPRKYQLNFLKAWDSGIRRFVLVWHRRSGKDKTCFSIVPKKAFERVGTYYYFAPTYSQGKKIIWDGIDKDGFRFLDHIPKEIIKGKPNETEMKIPLINGSVIQIIGTDNIDSIVGTNPIGCIFTEYSLQDPRAWDFIRPILAENEGWAVFVFTPRGMNHGFKILQQAKDSDKWFWEILTVDDTEAISPEILEQEKQEMPQDLFEQEYYCKFIEGAGAFFRRISENIHVTQHSPEPLHRYRMGVDLAKYQDYTVITVLDLMTYNVVDIERFNQIDWNLQKAKIEAAYLRWFKPLTYLDSTGVGDPIYDDLLQRGVKNLQSYKFTEVSRKDLLVNLQLLLEQGKIKIPENQILIEELRSMRYEMVGERGKTAIRVPEGLHDDMIMSLALSCWELPQNPLPLPNSLLHLTNTQTIAQTSYE